MQLTDMMQTLTTAKIIWLNGVMCNIWIIRERVYFICNRTNLRELSTSNHYENWFWYLIRIRVLSILNDIKCIQLCMYNTLNRRENVCSCNIIRLFYSTLINQSHHQAYSQNNEKHSFQTNIPFRPFLFICLLLIHCMAFDYECILTKRIQDLSLNRRATQKMMHYHTWIF